MLTLHLLEQSRALRILWLLEILGADYTLQTYPRDPHTLLAPEALKRIHPLGKSPLLQDGSNQHVADDEGVVVGFVDGTGEQRI